MKKVTKVALMTALLMGLVGGLFAANKYDLTFYKPGKMSVDVGIGWVGWGFGAVADFDYTLGNFNIGFGPINYKLGALVDFGIPFYSGYTYLGTGGFYFNFAVGAVFSVSWAMGNVIPDNSFLNKLEYYWGIGVGYYYDGLLAAVDAWSKQYLGSLYSSVYFPIVFITKAGVKYHFSDTMSVVLQECLTYYWNTTIGIEFKF